jgi:IclR family transcriptional regulator, pca regulon regulatory protein
MSDIIGFRMAKNPPKTEFVASLERGLRVLGTFSREHAQLTLSEVAVLTELSPATARRSLHTLELLGYVGRTGRRFLLRPKVLAISSGYLSAINAEVVLQPFLQDVVNEVGGSSSVTVLDEIDIVYIAHASLNRAIRLTAGAGSRYPVYPTSMGRVLLAFQPEAVIEAYFERVSFRKLTEHTETDQASLRKILKDVRSKGYAAIQDELDYGIVSVSVPVFGPHGRIVAAANCSDVTNRLDRDTMIKKRLPILRQAVRRIEGMLTQHPELTNSVESVASDYIRTRAVARVGQPAPATKSSGRRVSSRNGR